MTAFLTLDNLPLRGKTVLVRADLNVPMQNGRVTDHERLERLLPTLRDLKAADARIVILSHFGRPNGKVDGSLSLRPIAAALEKIWGQPVAFVEASIGPLATEAIQKLLPGQILVLENTRFHEGEESNDLEFSRSLAALGDVYINDAFSAAHRAHASTEGIAHHLPSAAGRLMQAEIDALTAALTNPEKPLAALVGGSKISTKLDLLNNLMGKVDLLVLGGGMANTFLAAKGISIGKSLFEPNMIETAHSIMAKAEANNCHIVLPKDVVIAKELKANVEVKTVAVKDMPDDWMILDLGPQSVKDIKENLSLCKTIVWNGPLGAFETEPFDRATNEVAIAVAELTKRGKVLSVAGGGDTASALANAGVANGFSYLSTAGGAFLEWLEGKELPGFIALRKAVTRQKVGKVIL